MNRHVVFKVLAGIVLLGAVIGIGALAFNAGVTHGLAIGAQATAGSATQAPLPVYLLPYGQPWMGLGGLGCFGVLMVLFLLFIIAGAARALFWRGRWGGHPMHHARWATPPEGGKGEGARCVPPIFDEWHRRAHSAPGDEPTKG
jgi:hypothetical protein